MIMIMIVYLMTRMMNLLQYDYHLPGIFFQSHCQSVAVWSGNVSESVLLFSL